jgi:hypothetical protein
MPKLNGVQIADRLRSRLEELRSGKDVAARDLKVLLTEDQIVVMDAAWSEQQALRKQKRAKTKEEEIALGWKTKRDIQIEACELALGQADDGMLEMFEELQRKAEIRQARVYLDSYSKARVTGKSEPEARTAANNDLTRAGLRRVDGQVVGHTNQRDRDVWEMEREQLKQARSEMSPEELEQIELLEQYEKALAKKLKEIGS